MATGNITDVAPTRAGVLRRHAIYNRIVMTLGLVALGLATAAAFQADTPDIEICDHPVYCVETREAAREIVRAYP